MILSAGRGERMRPLSDVTPKPLLQAGGKPLIVWQIERLARAGIHDIVINIAHLGEQFEPLLGNGDNWNVRLYYSDERAEGALESAGGIIRALELLGERFLVVNGDVWCDAEYSSLRLERGDLAHLLLVPNPQHNVQGDFTLRDGRVGNGTAARLTFSGIGCYHRDLFTGCGGGAQPLGPLLRRYADAGRVGGSVHSGQWIDVGTPQRLSELQRNLRA